MNRPFWKSQAKRWCVWVPTSTGRKCVTLHADEQEALKIWHRMSLAENGADDTTTLSQLIDAFIQWTAEHREQTTADFYAAHLESLASKYGHLKVGDVRTRHLREWLTEKYGGTGPTYQAGAVKTVRRLFNWAAQEEIYTASAPAKGLEAPTANRREVTLTADEWQTVMATPMDESLRDILTIMHATGCRPKEARIVEARHVDRSNSVWRFAAHESKGKKLPRVVPLSADALALTERLMLKYPTGPLFRNAAGKSWTMDALTNAIGRLSKRAGVEFTAYHLRHLFATEALVKGVEPTMLAVMLGHSNTATLYRHYQQLHNRPETLQAALAKIHARR